MQVIVFVFVLRLKQQVKIQAFLIRSNLINLPFNFGKGPENPQYQKIAITRELVGLWDDYQKT